jgi:NitT/TauT family transport system ATP-binding protein
MMPVTRPALQLNNVSKTFGTGARALQALAPLDLTIRTGEFVCLLGSSGCGKSTLLSLLAGLESPTTGALTCNGVPIVSTGVERVLLFQDAALFPWLTVLENAAFGLKQAGIGRAAREAHAASWLTRVGLAGFERSFVHELSGGMRQRVALARALVIDPAVLLMDEPFGALDALTRDRLHHELETIWRATGKTIVFVTHNVREAVALGDRVLVFSPRPGKVIGEFAIDLPRPRTLDDVAVIKRTADIMDLLRGAVGADAHELAGAFI